MMISEPIEHRTPRVNSKVLCELRVMIINECTTSVGAGDDGGGCANVGAEAYGKPLYIPLDFAIDLKPHYKIKS